MAGTRGTLEEDENLYTLLVEKCEGKSPLKRTKLKMESMPKHVDRAYGPIMTFLVL